MQRTDTNCKKAQHLKTSNKRNILINTIILYIGFGSGFDAKHSFEDI